jgi:hypothetical protein
MILDQIDPNHARDRFQYFEKRDAGEKTLHPFLTLLEFGRRYYRLMQWIRGTE